MSRSVMTTSDNLRKQIWEEELYRDTLKETFFVSRLGGDAYTKLEKGQPFESSPNDIIQVKTAMEAKGRTKTRNGDKITFGLVPRIDPATYPGVRSGQKLKGKEVPLSWYDFAIELERYRQAISAGSPMDWHRASFNMPTEAEAALKNWGVEILDKICFDALAVSTGTPFFYKTAAGVLKTTTAATAKTALTVADGKLTPQMVSFMKTWGITGGGRTYIPPRPVKIKGKNYYALIVHPDVVYDWKQDSTVQQASREAEVRGSENPLFTGASYIWDGVVIHENENITVGTDAGAGSDVAYSVGHLLGAQALCFGWGERPSIVEDTEDYQEDLFYAWRMTCAVEKPVFNSKAYGSFSFYIARTNVSGA